MSACRRSCADPVCLAAGCRGAACAGSCADPVCAEIGCLELPAWAYRDMLTAGLRAQKAGFAYEALRHEYLSRRERWDAAHPDATPTEREAACARICRELGI